jgi:hypothetical protein
MVRVGRLYSMSPPPLRAGRSALVHEFGGSFSVEVSGAACTGALAAAAGVSNQANDTAMARNLAA